MVDVAPVAAARQPVGLARMKQIPELAGMALLRQSRLSVCPVSAPEWRLICGLAGLPE
jgi:predicted RNA-binding protein with PUA-like domain